ncbi:14557_t:CDS:1, partial [Racocetra fulgida]
DTSGQKQNFIIRVSLVNYHGNAILDEIIRQPFNFTEFRSNITGVTPEIYATKG